MPRLERGGIRELVEDISAKVDLLSAGGLYHAILESDNVQVGDTADFGVKLWTADGEPVAEEDITEVGTYRVQRIRTGSDTTITAATPASKAIGRVYVLYEFAGANFQDEDIFYIVFSGIKIDPGSGEEEIPTQVVWGRIITVETGAVALLEDADFGLEAIDDYLEGTLTDKIDTVDGVVDGIWNAVAGAQGLSTINDRLLYLSKAMEGLRDAPLADMLFYSHMNSATEAEDISGNGWTLAASGTPVLATGYYGDGINCNNAGKFSKSVTIPDFPFSFACWVKFASVVGNVVIGSFYLSGTNWIQIRRAGNKIDLNWQNGATEYNQSFSPTVIADTWYPIVVIFESTTSAKLYYNSTLYSLTPSTDFLSPAGAGTFFVGGGNWSYFTGTIDEVGLWNKILTEAECEALEAIYTASIAFDLQRLHQVYANVEGVSAELANATYGLEAIKDAVDVIDGIVDTIDTNVDSIQDAVEHATYGLAAINTNLQAQMALTLKSESTFESGTDSWTATGTGFSVSQSSTIAAGGTYSLKVETSTLGTGGCTRTFTGYSPNTYLVRCWVSADGGTEDIVVKLTANSVTDAVTVTNNMTSTPTWLVLAVACEADGAGQLVVTVTGTRADTGTYFYVDSIEVFEVADATGSLLLDSVINLIKKRVDYKYFEAGSLLDILHKNTSYTYDKATDSLEALRDISDSRFEDRVIWAGAIKKSAAAVEITSSYTDILSYTAPSKGAFCRDITLVTELPNPCTVYYRVLVTENSLNYITLPGSVSEDADGAPRIIQLGGITVTGSAVVKVQAKTSISSVDAFAYMNVWEPETLP